MYFFLTHLKDLWLHLCWSSLEMRPVFPAHSTLSQAKYMALLRWLMVRHSRSTLSERCMALLAASRASTELPRRSTVEESTPVPLKLWYVETTQTRSGCFTHTFLSDSCVPPADWQFCGSQLLRHFAEWIRAARKHTVQPCERTTHSHYQQTHTSPGRKAVRLTNSTILCSCSWHHKAAWFETSAGRAAPTEQIKVPLQTRNSVCNIQPTVLSH